MGNKNLSIRIKLLIGFFIILAILTTLGVLSIINLSSIRSQFNGLLYATNVERYALKTVQEEKNYLLNEEEKYYKLAMDDISQIIKALDIIDKTSMDKNLLEKSQNARKGTLSYKELYIKGVELLKGNQEAVKDMIEKGDIVAKEADEFLAKQVRDYMDAMKIGRTGKELDGYVQRYIITTNIYEHALKIMKHEKEERIYKDRKNYDTMKVLLPELMDLYDDLKEITFDREGVAAIKNAREATVEYQAAAVKWIANDDELNKVLEEMETLGNEVMTLAYEAAGFASDKMISTQEATNFIILITMIIAIILGIVVALIIANIISKPLLKVTDTLKNSSSQIALASNQLSSSSQDIANGATEQASSIEETTSSMEELASMVRQNAGNSKEASILSDKASDASQDGYNKMETMLESMTEINKGSDQIRKVIKVIDDIAFQTNILALNAAVEAARAGEAGMGFAVVADEVKNLANRSAEAAKETSGMIEESIKKTGAGLEVATKLSEVFKEILTNIQKVTEMSKEVETASKQQDMGINQTNKAIIQLDEVVQSNASSAEEAASSSEELSSQAETLNDIVGQLVSLVTGKMEIGEHKLKLVEHKKKGVDIKKKRTQITQKAKRKEISPEKVIPFEEDEEFTKIDVG
ncbi:MAG: hypothetical protein KAR08_08990 [Candidatus Heimdallarchaeota archaeon]|nr:hypothetical protein [Candidatus Heimdallarchaeota archaeon]